MASTLRLTVISYGEELRSGLSRSFGPGRFAIGRGAGNDWVLADPERHLSNRHCIIEGQDGRYAITDFSTNGVFINGAERALGHGCSSPLDDGDRVLIGDYQMAVEIKTPVDEAALPAPVFGDVDPFSSSPVGGPEPGDALAARNDPSAPAKSAHDSEAAWPLENPLEPRLGSFPSAAGPPAGLTAFDTGRSDGPGADHVPAVNSFFRVPEVRSPIIPPDWDALPIEAPAAPGLAGGEIALPSALGDESRSPPAAAEPANSAPQAGGRPQLSSGGVASAALRAFLEGAGLHGAAPGSPDAEARLRAYGALFRELASGVRDLLATRTLMKSEFRIPQTIIRANDNNPLKFSVDLEQALEALLAPKSTGYAEPLTAVREAIDDLKAHEIGVIAGMQKAVAQLLGTLAPAALEHSIESKGLLASLVPAARKARCWEAYETLYREVAADLEEDVRGAFRRSFATAYSEQVKKL